MKVRGFRAAAAAAILAGTFATGVGLGGADPLPLVCDAFSGNGVVMTPNGDGTFSWNVQGSGVCSGGFPENYNVSFSGTGQSQGNGICTREGTSVKLSINATYTNSQGSKNRALTWTVPVALGVEAMPFVVSGESSGAGTISTRIFLKCQGTGGTDAARFLWAQTI